MRQAWDDERNWSVRPRHGDVSVQASPDGRRVATLAFKSLLVLIVIRELGDFFFRN